MKTTIQLTAMFLFGILFTVTACTKDKNMAGEHKDWNVLEWTVDGERYKAECEGDPLFGCDPVDCQYYHDIKSLYISGSSTNSGIIIYKYRNLKEGESNDFEKGDYFKYGNTHNYEDSCTSFINDTSFNYSLRIEEIDTINKFIRGSFFFTAINTCYDTTDVKNGYFKLTYRP